MDALNAPDTLDNVHHLDSLHKLAPKLTPRGHLLATPQDDAPPLAPHVSQELQEAFALGSGHGLLLLGTKHVGQALPPAWAWWRAVATLYVTALCAVPEDGKIELSMPESAEFDALIADLPPMTGAEYVTAQGLAVLWKAMDGALKLELAAAGLPLQAFLKSRHPAWNLVGRVHFNLAENRKDPDAPFAFLATYTARLSAHGTAQHQPLSQALAEFSDSKSRAQLLSLLLPVKRAAEHCGWLREMVETGDIYHPLRWTALDAFRFLSDLAKLEAAGIIVRTPKVWKAGKPLRPVVKVSVGTRAPSLLGQNALLDFSMHVCLDGENLNDTEIEALLQRGDGLQFIRGRWVEVDRKAIGRLLERFKAIEAAAENGLSFAPAMRLLAGASLDESGEPLDADWSELAAGPWLADTLAGLRKPEGLAQIDPGPELKTTLRPYQQAGVRWLYLLTRLGLGACLADDMGLGKTIQVLALLLVLKREGSASATASAHQPSLLVAPASLLANWAAEAGRFAPNLRVLVAHPSAMPPADFKALDAARLAGADLVITSYGSLLRQPLLQGFDWRLFVIDEAQAIKNPGTRQTRQVKKIKAQSRIALTGTPVENRLSDLWSIFDFTHPGLLGTDKVFAKFTKRLAAAEHFGPLRALVQPYILRRLKTDKQVISDLPDKTEVKAWCLLSPLQAALYQQSVQDLANALEDAEGIGRKGVVLSFLMRFKQICNHPSQWLGDGAWKAPDSGKFARLKELAEVIAAKQEKVLVFTQFRETTEPLAAFLGSIFGREGLVLHGATPVAKRRELVRRFQEDEQTPFFVLSLKAGGAGLNLTAASHVIHFDRWWNPAVENQATDRAFRIGQQRNVLVHKFVCQGTVEDRIDQLIESKQQLVRDVLEGGAELLLTEMSDRELLDLVKLDIHAAKEN
ncbi:MULTISPECIES: DEAD/DEAH box helicase [unclassified Polaromonas]|uniref:DEAD/DEAH box helicase n=1 Tax=unclassified Polaromonas TaxID=2638319 RepID=UPI0018C92ACB|nr:MULTISPECIES: DEAD/DEAH box helicase [unclassified Polaromonas]MBG6073526.1 non-specific serine/threonine protein kinase [Polaromonas sp. CG_9.7]MBG6115528.1 non-specific serine/threonine protein kinase [Polaromonas sp. CG_9.2]